MGIEKEYNGNLYDQLTIIERLDQAEAAGKYKEESAKIKKEINRKLYQKPPLSEE